MEKIVLKSFEDSSVIKLGMWNPATEDLIVIFNTGSIWSYGKIPYTIWWSLYSADSAGKYFNNNIRGKYTESCIYKPGAKVV